MAMFDDESKRENNFIWHIKNFLPSPRATNKWKSYEVMDAVRVVWFGPKWEHCIVTLLRGERTTYAEYELICPKNVNYRYHIITQSSWKQEVSCHVPIKSSLFTSMRAYRVCTVSSGKSFVNFTLHSFSSTLLSCKYWINLNFPWN